MKKIIIICFFITSLYSCTIFKNDIDYKNLIVQLNMEEKRIIDSLNKSGVNYFAIRGRTIDSNCTRNQKLYIIFQDDDSYYSVIKYDIFGKSKEKSSFGWRPEHIIEQFQICLQHEPLDKTKLIYKDYYITVYVNYNSEYISFDYPEQIDEKYNNCYEDFIIYIKSKLFEIQNHNRF